MIGAPIEDTISIMQLITHGIPTRYPAIKIINSHLGGALPMLLQRERLPVDVTAATAGCRCRASHRLPQPATGSM
jgi:hypothetical protein